MTSTQGSAKPSSTFGQPERAKGRRRGNGMRDCAPPSRAANILAALLNYAGTFCLMRGCLMPTSIETRVWNCLGTSERKRTGTFSPSSMEPLLPSSNSKLKLNHLSATISTTEAKRPWGMQRTFGPLTGKGHSNRPNAHGLAMSSSLKIVRSHKALSG